MGLFSESVDVICTETGQPSHVHWKGQRRQVINQPDRWYERRQWWAEETRAPLGSGTGLVDHEIWRVQLTTAQEPDPITLDLVRHLGSGRWRVLRIHDAAPAHAVEPDEAA
ncbi:MULTISPECIES: DUF6504 family protein [unclassified Paenarthrobacter]|uniref:DUF6504 family protein n=1 Tax=unclassified Paenarthrobacter TaxID=2634190 RepID=UPI003CF7FC31